MATWVHSMNATTTLINDFRDMSNDVQNTFKGKVSNWKGRCRHKITAPDLSRMHRSNRSSRTFWRIVAEYLYRQNCTRWCPYMECSIDRDRSAWKPVVSFTSKKTQNVVSGKPVKVPEDIYVQAIGLLLSDHAKSVLRQAIGATTNKRAFGNPKIFIIYVSSYLWTVKWPSQGQLMDVLNQVWK